MTFDNIVGQSRAKEKVNYYLEAYKAGKPFPTTLFAGQTGGGKTALATACGKTLKELSGNKKRFLTINASAIKSLRYFIESIVIPHIHDKDVTMLFDEASELDNDTTMALLTILNPNDENRTSYPYGDAIFDFDFNRQTFLFATSEPQDIFSALMKRFRRIDLEEYTNEDLIKILIKKLPGIEFKDDILTEAATVLRQNPRQTILLAQDISTYLAFKGNKTSFGKEDWAEIKRRLDILPLGLSRTEIRLLEILSQKRDLSLTRIGAALNLTADAVRRDYELYLQRLGLIEIGIGSKRNISGAGMEYLRNLGLAKV